MKKATEAVVTDARFRVMTALAKAQFTPRIAAVTSCLQLYFKTTADRDIQTICAKLEIVMNGINADVNIKVSKANTWIMKTYWDMKKSQRDEIEGYAVPGSVKHDIHVKPDYMKNNPWQAARTFIHEASHQYASTADFGTTGYIKADGSDFRRAGISPDDCLNNADSYAYFVMKVTD